jgi:hypothetical protein
VSGVCHGGYMEGCTILGSLNDKKRNFLKGLGLETHMRTRRPPLPATVLCRRFMSFSPALSAYTDHYAVS